LERCGSSSSKSCRRVALRIGTVPRLPGPIWIAVAGVLLVMLTSVVATTYLVLRAPSRARIREWPRRCVLACVVAAAVPWLVIRLSPISIDVSIHSLGPLLAWLLLALMAFAVTVLAPLGALLAVLVWLGANHRRLFGSR
jgi:hypothetical protein